MRRVLLVILLLPGASAASQVHLTYTGDAYAVTYRGGEPLVETPNATAFAEEAGGGWKRAQLKLGDALTSYSIGTRRSNVTLPPAPHEATRVVFVADMGVDANASRIARAIANVSPDLVLVGGDLSYAHADVATWDRWFDLMEPVASRVPVMPAFGNHEHYCTQNETSFVRCDAESARWDQHFALPNGDKRYYAFDWGPLRVTTLDTEAYVDSENRRITDPAAQESFLRASLAADTDRWDVVMFHRPLRTTLDRAGAALPPEDAARLAGILGASDLVLQAHVHAYERSTPGPNGTIHVTSGGGGRELYDTWAPQEPWVATRAAAHHFVVLDVTPARIAARAVDVNGTTLDTFSLDRAVPASLRPPATPSTQPAPTRTTPVATPGTTPTAAPTSIAAPTPPFATGDPRAPLAESNATPLGPGPLLAALALTAWRRRAARRARG